MIVRRVSLSMISGCHYGHLVAVDTVEPEEKLDLLRNLKMMVITNIENKDIRRNFLDNKYTYCKLSNPFEFRMNLFGTLGIKRKKNLTDLEFRFML